MTKLVLALVCASAISVCAKDSENAPVTRLLVASVLVGNNQPLIPKINVLQEIRPVRLYEAAQDSSHLSRNISCNIDRATYRSEISDNGTDNLSIKSNITLQRDGASCREVDRKLLEDTASRLFLQQDRFTGCTVEATHWSNRGNTSTIELTCNSTFSDWQQLYAFTQETIVKDEAEKVESARIRAELKRRDIIKE